MSIGYNPVHDETARNSTDSTSVFYKMLVSARAASLLIHHSSYPKFYLFFEEKAIAVWGGARRLTIVVKYLA